MGGARSKYGRDGDEKCIPYFGLKTCREETTRKT
jgi:hypothetical protein